MNNDTPRTEENAKLANSCSFQEKLTMEVCEADFARELERENNKLRRALKESSSFWQAVSFHYGKDHLCRDDEAQSLAIRDSALSNVQSDSLRK
jgi:hypothetical protein